MNKLLGIATAVGMIAGSTTANAQFAPGDLCKIPSNCTPPKEVQRLLQNLREIQEAGKAQAEARQQELQQRRAEAAKQREIEESEPQSILGKAYVGYILVKKCYDSRQGYLAVNISEPEMAHARTAIKRLEEIMKPKVTGWPNDSLWTEAVKRVGQANLGRDGCQMYLRGLLGIYRTHVPEDNTVAKDF